MNNVTIIARLTPLWYYHFSNTKRNWGQYKWVIAEGPPPEHWDINKLYNNGHRRYLDPNLVHWYDLKSDIFYYFIGSRWCCASRISLDSPENKAFREIAGYD
jgi:hypothetical protein